MSGNEGLRRSGRKRQLSITRVEETPILWSEDERFRLLKALKKHGHIDIISLRESVPEKSDTQIRDFINVSWKAARRTLMANAKKARKGNKQNKTFFGPTDQWLEIINNHFRCFDDYKYVPIARAMLFISKYEEHPDPSECGGVNFQDLYDFVYCMLCGFPPKVLNRPTAEFLLEVLKSFARSMRKDDFKAEADFIKSCSHLVCPSIPSSKPNGENNLHLSIEECFSELMQLPGFNPFDVPKEMLNMKFVAIVAYQAYFYFISTPHVCGWNKEVEVNLVCLIRDYSH